MGCLIFDPHKKSGLGFENMFSYLHTHTHAVTSKSYGVQYLVLIDNVAMTQVPNESNEMSFETEGRMGVSAPWPCQGEIVCCGEHIFTSFTQ